MCMACGLYPWECNQESCQTRSLITDAAVKKASDSGSVSTVRGPKDEPRRQSESRTKGAKHPENLPRKTRKVVGVSGRKKKS